MDPVQIPEKTYFKIGEIAKLLNLEPYVLRYWETEFEQLRPEKTKTGQRAYQRRDVELLVQIRELLYEDMYTIAGARRQLVLNRQGELPLVEDESASEQLVQTQAELELAQSELAETRATMNAQAEEIESLNAEILSLQDRIEASPSSNPQELEMLERHMEVVTQERDELRAALVAREQRRRRAITAVRTELQELRALAT